MGQHDRLLKPDSRQPGAERPAVRVPASGSAVGMEQLLRTPGLAPPELIRGLGNSVGNGAVARMLAPSPAQPVVQRVVSINNELLPDQTKTKSYGRLSESARQMLQTLIADRTQIYDFPSRAALYAYLRDPQNAAGPTITAIPQKQLEEARKKRRQAVFHRKTESESHLSSNDAFHGIPREQLYRLTQDRWWQRNPLTDQYERRKRKGTAAIPNEELLEYVDPKNPKKENYGYLRDRQVITTRTDPSSTANFSRKGATGIQYTDARGGYKSRRVFPGVNSGKPTNPFKRATDQKTFTIGHSQAVKNMHRGLDKYGKNSDEQSRMMVPENRKVGEQMKNPALEPEDRSYVWNNFYNAHPDTTLSGNPIPDNTEATIFQPDGKTVDFNVFLDNTGNTDYKSERANARGTRDEKKYTYGEYMKEKLSRPYQPPSFFTAEDDGAISDDEEVPRTPAFLPQFSEEQTHDAPGELPYGSVVDIGNKKWEVGWFSGKSATGGKSYQVSRPRFAPTEESEDSDDESAQQPDPLASDVMVDDSQPPALIQQPSVDASPQLLPPPLLSPPLQQPPLQQPSLSEPVLPLLQQQSDVDFQFDDQLFGSGDQLFDDDESQGGSLFGTQLPPFADLLSDQLPFFVFGQGHQDEQLPSQPLADQQHLQDQPSQHEWHSVFGLLPPFDLDRDMATDQAPQQSASSFGSEMGDWHGSMQPGTDADSSDRLLDMLLQDQQDADFTADLIHGGLLQLPSSTLRNDDQDLFQSMQQPTPPDMFALGGMPDQGGSSRTGKRDDRDAPSDPPAKRQKVMSQQEIALGQQHDQLSAWVELMLDLLVMADEWISVRAGNNENVSSAQQQVGWAQLIVGNQSLKLNAMLPLQQPLSQHDLALCDRAWDCVIEVLRLLAVRGPIHQLQHVEGGIYLLPSLEQHFHECGQMSMHTALALDAHVGSLAAAVPNALIAALQNELSLRQLGGFEDDINEDQIRAGLAAQGITHIPIVNGLEATHQLVRLIQQSVDQDDFSILYDAYGEESAWRDRDQLNRLYAFFKGQIHTLTVIVNTDAEQELGAGHHWITARLERTNDGGINVFYTDSLRDVHDYRDLLNGLRSALTRDNG